MTTAGDLVDLVSEELHGWGLAQDRVTSLTTGIGPTDLSFTVDAVFGQAVGISAGVVEMDAELLYVTNVDKNSMICTVAPFGRGYQGTTAASHATGIKITSRPKFPRNQILKEINNVIGAVFPDLFAVGTDATQVITYPSNSYTYVGLVDALDVQYQDYLGRWNKVRAYNVDPYDHSLRLAQYAPLGQPLRVLFMKEPTKFTAESDNYSVTGLPDSSQDVLTKGAASRLALGLDISRAQMTTSEQADRSRLVPPHAGSDIGKFLLAEHLDRLKNEAAGLRKIYPPRMVKRF